jgi:hypothetical protein
MRDPDSADADEAVGHLAARPLTCLRHVPADRDACLQRVVTQLGVGLCQRFGELAQDAQPVPQAFELLAGRFSARAPLDRR